MGLSGLMPVTAGSYGGEAVPSPVPSRQDTPMSAFAALDPQAWTGLSACRDADPDELFVTGAAHNRAKAVCLGCPVRTECLSDALDNRVEFGVWGGMTERERRALLRRRPDVASWRLLLEQARAEHAGTGCAVCLGRDGGGRPGREIVTDRPQPVEVVHVARQGRDLDHGHARVRAADPLLQVQLAR